MTRVVAEIFKEPAQWDFRGDALLWDYLRDYFAGVALPYSVGQFQADLFRIFEQVAGQAPKAGERYLAEPLARENGAAPVLLSGDFWMEEAIPALSQRLDGLNGRLTPA